MKKSWSLALLLSLPLALSCNRDEPTAATFEGLTPSFNVSGTFTLGGGPYGSVVTSSNTAWISQSTNGTVTQMNITGGTFSNSVCVWSTCSPVTILPFALDKNSDGSLIYVGAFDESTNNKGVVASIATTGTPHVVDRFSLPAGDVSGIIATTGNIVYAGVTDGPIYKIQLANGGGSIVTSRTFSTAYAYHFAWNQDKSSLYASSYGQGVYKLNPADLSTQQFYNGTTQTQGLALSADGTKLYVASYGGSIVVLDAGTLQFVSSIVSCHAIGLLLANYLLYTACTTDGLFQGFDTFSNGMIESDNTTGRPREISFDAGTQKIVVPNESGWVNVITPPAYTVNGHFVAVGGGSDMTHSGSITDPWALQYAFNGAGSRIHPGDTVWIRGNGGVYNAGGTGKYTVSSSLSGTANNYIVFRAYPNERPVLEDPTITGASQLNVSGSYLAFWGLEVRDANTNRTTVRSSTVYNRGDHNKYINLIIHDGNVAFLTEPPGTNTEITGSIIYNNGYDIAGDRGHGHAIYIKNTAPSTVLARDNIMFNQFGFGIHAYTDKTGEHVDNVTLRRNVGFNNGTITSNLSSGSSNLMVGADVPGIGGSGVVVDSNMTYWSYNPSGSFAEGINAQIGRNPTATPTPGAVNPGTVQVTNNYFVGQGTGGRFLLDVGDWPSGSGFTNNQFLDCSIDISTMTPVCGGTTNQMVAVHDVNHAGITWSGNTHTHSTSGTNMWSLNGSAQSFTTWTQNMPASDALVTTAPSTPKVFPWKTLYETGRGNIVVYNWGNVASVDVDLTGIVPIGKWFKIWNVYDLNTPVVSLTYQGGSVNLPIATYPVPAPTGWTTVLPQSTGKAFNAYIVRIAPF